LERLETALRIVGVGQRDFGADVHLRFGDGLAERTAADECWFLWGIDDLMAKLPPAWLAYREVGPHADEGVRFERGDGSIVFRSGPIGDRLLATYRDTVARMALRGLNVIVDEVIVNQPRAEVKPPVQRRPLVGPTLWDKLGLDRGA